jgi:DNA-binding PadR family transcriptional regulator
MTTPATTRTDLLLLGLLLDQPVHGYDLYQKIQAEGIDEWFNISMAGVYYSLGKLRDQGLVVETRQRGGRSARKSIYRLTDEGRSAFFTAMETQAKNQDRTCLDFDLVIYLLNKLPLQRAIDLLIQRQDFLAQQMERVVALETERKEGRSPLKLAILDHSRRFLEMEQDWLESVIAEIQMEGEVGYRLVDLSNRQGLMVLSGDLSQHHMPDLLHLITSGQHTGTLTISDGQLVRALGFEGGRLVCMACTRRGEEPPTPPGCIEEIQEKICELFCWQEGRFTFDQTICNQDWCVPVEISVSDLILRGCRRVEDWRIIQQLVPSADSVFERGSPRRLDGLHLTPTEEQIVAAIDGVKTVTSIARELGLTVFEASRAFYCLAAVSVLRTADPDKIRLRRLFREIAELMCNSTLAWRDGPNDRSCEKEVNRQCAHLPLALNQGRIEDQTDPQLKTDDLVKMYRLFLKEQLDVVGRRFGRERARQSFQRTLRRLAPELQDTAKRHGFDRL